MNDKMLTNRFHGSLDNEPVVVHHNFKITEREVSYGFYLHQHPYVKQLMQRLISKGTSELLAADTEYKKGNASLPGSIEFGLKKDEKLELPAGAKVILLENLNVNFGAKLIELSEGMKVEFVEDAVQATLPYGMRAQLVEGMTLIASIGEVFKIPANKETVVLDDTIIMTDSDATIILYSGEKAKIPAGTKMLFVSGNTITLTERSVELIKSKPLPALFEEFFNKYIPNKNLVRRPYPVKDLEFTSSGAYSVYNWELFYHVPIMIAIHLSKNQRFTEAQQWFHFLFDPTDNSDEPTPERYWKVRPFQYTDVKKIEEILVNLSTRADDALYKDTINSINAWKDAPFRPHVIARFRQQAYMYKTVMAYLDNLIAWGDSLFRQDTGEAIDEALQLYVMAVNILGTRPQAVPKKGSVHKQTYANMRYELTEFGNVMKDMEADIPFDLMPFPSEDSGDNGRYASISSLGKTLYFCVPRNDQLLNYWDTLADRLFKIRNSLNFQGIFRQLALFEPPIDPAMLARAAAAGLDISAIVNGLNQPIPLVRFQLLVQKASEIVQEVKSLGNNLLSAMEKQDGEALAIMRAKHERVIMGMVEHVRYDQLQEAIKAREGLLQSLAMAVQRYTYYEQQLGKKIDEIEKSIPEFSELDKDSLDKMKFTSEEPKVVSRDIQVDIAKELGGSGGKIISSYESQELEYLQMARICQTIAAGMDAFAGAMAILPNFGAKFHPFGAGGSISFGGSNLSAFYHYKSSFIKMGADQMAYEAGKAGKIGSYSRREQDWAFQSNLAAGEITQIFKQLRAAQIREAIAEQELKNHRQQMKHAEEIERFLNEEGTEKTGKKTNQALYAWMRREVKGLYSQCFQFAFDIAKKAERALQHELGNPEFNYIQFGYLAGKEGLLAGEKLFLDVKRMEMAFHDLNQREYELTKHVSLLQVDPLALIQLRMTGRCTVQLPEELFDMDGPGHYFRRIKTVAVSIPCVSGPYASVNCTLTLLKSSIRKNQTLQGGAYAREDAEDNRFSDYFGSMQSIVTSSAQNDSGMFETNLRDERYLPFENSGVISEWQLQLPGDPSKNKLAQFDYNTISDVILHIRYTAREGGGLLRNGAIANISAAKAKGSVRLFSIRHEFPTEWAEFQKKDSVPTTKLLTLNLRKEHYPFWSQPKDSSKVIGVEILAQSMVSIEVTNEEGTQKDDFDKDSTLGDLLVGKLQNVEKPKKPVGELKLFFNSDAIITDMWIAITWTE